MKWKFIINCTTLVETNFFLSPPSTLSYSALEVMFLRSRATIIPWSLLTSCTWRIDQKKTLLWCPLTLASESLPVALESSNRVSWYTCVRIHAHKAVTLESWHEVFAFPKFWYLSFLACSVQFCAFQSQFVLRIVTTTIVVVWWLFGFLCRQLFAFTV